jgi:hypothetical protein
MKENLFEDKLKASNPLFIQMQIVFLIYSDAKISRDHYSYPLVLFI